MSQPTPPPPFPFEAFAHDRARLREAEKRGLWKGLLAVLKSYDVLERVAFCPITLAGLAVMVDRMLDEPGFLSRAYEAGLAATKGFMAPEAQTRIEPLQVVVGTEPDQVLLARLASEGFQRMTGPGMEPVIYMGRGALAAWKGVQISGVRVTKLDLPGGTIQGLAIVVEGEVTAAERDEQAGTAGANPGATGSTPTGAALTRSDEVPGAEAGRGRAGASAAAVTGTRGAALSRACKAIVRSGPVDATPEPARPYRWAEVSAPTGTPDWTLHRASDAEREALMLAAVMGQGPVNREMAIEAVRLGIATRSILTHGRTRLRNALDRLESDNKVIRTEGGFYDLPGRPVLARDRTGCDERLRRLSSLPPIEVDAAIREELMGGGPVAEAALVVGAARRLGYALKSPATNLALAGIIAGRIAVLVEAQNDPVIRGADGLMLTSSPAEPREGEEREDGNGTGSAVDPGKGDVDDQPLQQAAE